MGMSLSAELVYGIDLGYSQDRYEPDNPMPWESDVDDEDYDENDEDDFEQWLVGLAGIEYPYTPEGEYPPEWGYPERDYSLSYDENDAREKAWETANPDKRSMIDTYHRAARYAVEECPLTMEHYGYEYGAQILAVRGLGKSGYESIMEIDPNDVREPTDEELASARKFCEDHGIKFEPRWYIVATWG